MPSADIPRTITIYNLKTSRSTAFSRPVPPYACAYINQIFSSVKKMAALFKVKIKTLLYTSDSSF